MAASTKRKVKRTAQQNPADIDAQKARLAAVIKERINLAGGLLGEVLDHMQEGTVTLAEVGALAEVQENISQAISLTAFYLRAEEKVVAAPGLLVPDNQIIV